MPFPNLFTGLPAFREDFRRQDRPNVTNRNPTNDKRGEKRKSQDEQVGSYNKRRCFRPRANYPDASKDIKTRGKFDQKHHGGSEHKPVNQTKQRIKNHGHKSGYNTRLNKDQQNQKQHQGKRTERRPQQDKQKNRHDGKNGRWMSRGRTRKDSRQDTRVKTRFMSDEFKEQNAMLVDGQLLCRHFLRGRCIKAGDCQLMHLQPRNDMIKEVCKFYIQGFCAKGESCPYMHKSFPCKFFHRKGKCTQDVNCRFSHEPLNEVTERLLNEVIKRENDLCELTKAKEELSVQPVNSEESDITEANRTHDDIIQPLRPAFYHSTDAEKESSVHQTEELADNGEEAASDAAQPHSSPSADCTQVEPGCYSVEAVLGAQQSRTFPSFFTTPESQETKSVCEVPQVAPDPALSSFSQSEVPYSVDAVLRSYKPITQLYCPPRAQTVSYTPQNGLHNQSKKVPLCIGGKANLPKIKTYKSLPSLQERPSLVSKTSSDVFLAPGEHKNQPEGVSQCQSDAQMTSHEVRQELLNSPNTEAERSASSPSKPLTEPKPDLSGLTPDTQSFRKPVCPSLGSKDQTSIAAPVGPVSSCIMTRTTAVHHFAVKQFTDIHLNPKRTRPIPKPRKLDPNSSKIPTQCHNQMSKDGHFSAGCKKAQPKLTLDSRTAPSGSQSFMKSQQPADVTDKISPKSLFAAPLDKSPTSSPCSPSQTAPSCSQQPVNDTPSNLKQRASGLGNSIQLQARQTSHGALSPKFSRENEDDPGEQILSPVCRPVDDCPNKPPVRGSGVSSPRDSAAETSSGSILKTLFLSLKPYQEETERQSRNPNSEGGKKDGVACGTTKQQQESRRKNGEKKNTDATLTEKTTEDSVEHQHHPQTSLKSAGPSPISQRDWTKSPVRPSPFKAVTPVRKHRARPRGKPPSKEGVKPAATPFNDLFKVLDMSVFSSGR